MRSEFWSQTDIIKNSTGTDFPQEMYLGRSGGMPPGEIVRALDPIEKGSNARLYIQYTFDSYVMLDIWADRIEDVTVPAGTFRALHLTMRPNPATFPPSWPGFVLKVIDQFIPKESFYFEAEPPLRFLEYDGVPGGAAGTEVNTELIRHWIAGTKRPGVLTNR